MRYVSKISNYLLSVVICLIVGTTVCQAGDTNSDKLFSLWQRQTATMNDSRASNLTNESALKDIKNYMLDNGIIRSTILANAYTVEGMAQLEKKRYHKAVWSFQAALSVNPAYVPAGRGLLVSSFKQGFGAFLLNLPKVISAYVENLKDPWNLLYCLGNFAQIFLVATLLGFVAIMITCTIKYFPLWKHEFAERLPSNAKYIPTIITIFLVSIPFLIGFGIVWAAVWWSILFYLFMRRGETTILWLFLLGIVLVIPANILRVTVIQAYEAPFIRAVAYARYGGYSDGAVNLMEEFQKQGTIDPDKQAKAHFILGTLYKRGGHYFDALKEYIEYTRLKPADPRGHINLGNIYFVLNNLGEAVSKYRRAENLDSRNAAVYFNLSKAYLHQFKFDQATGMLEKASRLDPEKVTFFTEIHSSNPNRMLMDCEVPGSWVWADLSSAFEFAFASQEKYWIRPGYGLGIPGLAMITGVLVIILMLLQLFRSKADLSHFCLMCGATTCSNCQKSSENSKYCAHCNLMFLKKGQIDHRERERKMREITQTAHRNWVISMILDVLFPGSGCIYRNNSVIGGILLVLWSFMVSIWLTIDYRLVSFWDSPTIGLLIGYFSYLFFLICIYLLAVLLAFKGRTE